MGILRLYLAVCVLYAHGGYLFNKQLPLLSGRDAVMLFYVISGFYMALILNEKYTTAADNTTFYLNRFLRLFPVYFVTLVAIGLGIVVSGRVVTFRSNVGIETVLQIFDGWSLPSWLLVLVSNVAIIGQDILWLTKADSSGISWGPYGVDSAHNGSGFSLVPPAFSVSLEIMFYLIAPLFARCGLRVILMLLIAAFLYHVGVVMAIGYRIDLNYHLFPATLYPFLLGVCAYKLSGMVGKEWFLENSLGDCALKIMGLIVVGGALLMWSPPGSQGLPKIFYFLPAFAVLIPTAFRLSRQSQLDRFLGDLSYPIYITHFPFLLYFPVIFGSMVNKQVISWAVLAASILLLVGVDRRVDVVRQRLVGRQPGSNREGL